MFCCVRCRSNIANASESWQMDVGPLLLPLPELIEVTAPPPLAMHGHRV